jgi:hypothetical protein
MHSSLDGDVRIVGCSIIRETHQVGLSTSSTAWNFVLLTVKRRNAVKADAPTGRFRVAVVIHPRLGRIVRVLLSPSHDGFYKPCVRTTPGDSS